LRAKLLVRANKHRGIRAAFRAGVVLRSAVAEVDRDNGVFLSQQLVAGWLGADLVGFDGAHACWLLVCEAATPAQRQVWLPWMHQAVAHGWADDTDLAFLEDRVARETGRAQPHGTVTYGDPPRLWPLAEPERLGELRARLHLPPLSAKDIAAAWTFDELARSAPAALGDSPAPEHGTGGGCVSSGCAENGPSPRRGLRS
jgi:hypothetical protein